jgi:hypothetical protein
MGTDVSIDPFEQIRIRLSKQWLRDCDAERLGSLEVDYQGYVCCWPTAE